MSASPEKTPLMFPTFLQNHPRHHEYGRCQVLAAQVYFLQGTAPQKKGWVSVYCHIRLKEHPDPSWQERLERLQIVQEPDGTSRLAGHLPDQVALSGVLAKLSHLNVTLLSPTCNDGAEREREQPPTAPDK